MRVAFLAVTVAAQLGGSVPNAKSPASSADFSGVDEFWRITDLLRSGEDPTDGTWDKMFATPGYAALQARERRRPSIIAAMRAAFLPSKGALRDSLLAANGWSARVIRHIETLPSRRAELDAAAARLRNDNALGRAIVRAQTLLPAGTDTLYGRPAVAFLFFLPDGRGYPGLIVADLANIMAKDDPVPFFAHEVTHFYWAHLSAARIRRDSASIDSGPGAEALESLLMKIAEESAGDQFDKVDAAELDSASIARRYQNPGWRQYLLDYQRELAHAPEELRRLDAVLATIAAQPAQAQKLSDSAAKALPLEGRALGMYMARTIRRQLGDRRFAAAAGDAVAYALAYVAASKLPGCRCVPLSEAAVRTVERLRHKRRVNPPPADDYYESLIPDSGIIDWAALCWDRRFEEDSLRSSPYGTRTSPSDSFTFALRSTRPFSSVAFDCVYALAAPWV